MAVHYTKLNKGAEKGVRICNAVYWARGGVLFLFIQHLFPKKAQFRKSQNAEHVLLT